MKNNFIRLTVVTGVKNVEGEVLVNPNRIFYLAPTNYINKERSATSGTNINGELIVKESIKEIQKAIFTRKTGEGRAEKVPVVLAKTGDPGARIQHVPDIVRKPSLSGSTKPKKDLQQKAGGQGVELECIDL